MGSPLAPALANILLGFYEFKWLNEFDLNKINFWLRYVNDILAAFDNKQNSLNFLDFLNKRHLNIKHTIEKQINHSIAFLMYSFQVSTIKISRFKHFTNRPMQGFSLILRVLHHFHIRLV